MTTTYTVECLRAGQPRPYADREYEYLVTVAEDGKPWVNGGDVEARIKRDEAARAAKTMFGGETPEQLRRSQREWAKRVLRALCMSFREVGDDDGIVEGSADAHFQPTLRSLRVDPAAGTIRARIVNPFTD